MNFSANASSHISANASSHIQRPRIKSLVAVDWIRRYALAFIFRVSCIELKA
jgi:hypothetical protein